ncbi:MAG: glycosyltransferase family 2 protein [Muribaculaceae bacterium]
MIISIITITYNNAAGLVRTIASLREQRDVEVEHIIVDGESTDGTAEILDRERKRATVITRRARGVYEAINAGIQAASGDIVGLLHAGDVFSDAHVLADVRKIMEKTDSPHYIYGDIHYNKRNGHPGRKFSGAPACRKTMLTGFQPPHLSLYIKREAQSRIGLYSLNYRIAGDYEMLLRIFFDDSLQGRYIKRDMVAMEPGGLATRAKSRLWTNNSERIKALKANGLPASWLALLKHYYYLFLHK